MIDSADLERAYDAAFALYAPRGIRIRAEAASDEPFLRELCLATFRLRDVLPRPLLEQQADIRVAAFRDNFPCVMRRILVGPGGPVGRIMLDWTHPARTHGVDIALLPSESGRGLGTALLHAWIDVAARHGLHCTFNVDADNPARRLYSRLGFQETSDDFGSPGIAMSLPPRP